MGKKEEIQNEKINKFLEKLEKDFGKGTVVDANLKETYGDVIPSTSFSLNMASGIGGFAKGKIYDIFADPSSGKSTLSYDVIGNCHKVYNEHCLLIEKEDSYGRAYGSHLGINNDLLTILNPDTQEDMYNILLEALQTNMFGVIVVDSLTSFAPKARFEGSQIMGIEARNNSHYMRLVMDAVQKSKTCLIILEQTRQKIGAMGDPTTTSGGTAVSFYSHVRIKITRSEIDKELHQNTMKFHFIKNKLAEPFKIGSIVYNWIGGFDTASEAGEIAIEAGIIKITGNSYFFPEKEDKVVGKKKAMNFLKDNPEYLKNVILPKVQEYLSNKEDKDVDENE